MNRDTRMDSMGRLTLLDNLANKELSPFFVLFGLFIIGFGIATIGMLLIVLGGRVAVAVFLLVLIFSSIAEVVEKRLFENQTHGAREGILNATEKWVIMLGWCIPRKHREAILGDILEDCHEMRKKGLPERRIRNHILWQWAISVVKLIPAFVIGAIGRLLGAK